MTKEPMKAGKKISVKQAVVSTAGSFVNYRTPTEPVIAKFNSSSSKPDSVASILANKTVVFSDTIIEINH